MGGQRKDREEKDEIGKIERNYRIIRDVMPPGKMDCAIYPIAQPAERDEVRKHRWFP